MKTILIVIGRDKSGGAEQTLKNVANAFLDKNDKVIVVSTNAKRYGFWDDYRGEIIFNNSRLDKFNILNFANVLFRVSRKNKIDITISSFVTLNGILGWFKQLGILKTKFIVVRESTIIFDRFNWRYRLLFRMFYSGYRFVNLIICQTNQMRNELLKHVDFLSPEKVKVFQNPVNLNKIDADAAINNTIDYGKYIVGCGRLRSFKGFDVLIEAYLSNNNLHENFNLVIIGNGDQQQLLEQKSGSWLNKKIFLVGYQSNPFPFFKNASICVIPYFKEGFPNTLLQMMALNSRVVSTLCADGIEKINGIVTCKVNDINDLSNALEKMANLNEIEVAKNKKQIDEFINANTIELYIERLESTLQLK